jgi:hypothetical protein
MDNQDWTPVVIKRRYTKKELIQKGKTTTEVRDPEKNEKVRLAKIENDDNIGPKKQVNADSLQELIRKRIELKINQERADTLCSFPRNTIKEIEAKRLLPNEEQKRRIQRYLGVQLKIDTISA